MAKAIVNGTETCFRDKYPNTPGRLFEINAADAEGEDDTDMPGQNDSDDENGFHEDYQGDFPSGEQAEPEAPVDPALMKAIKNLHVNTGHRPPKVLARALHIAGAPAEAIRAVKLLKCDVCKQIAKPKTRRPASIPRARHFNDQVHMDLLQIADAAGTPIWCLNIVDADSSFQVIHVLENKTSSAVIEAYERSWVVWAGHPPNAVLDMGPEFASDEFCEHLEAYGVKPYHTPVEAPWQNGVCERAGGAFKVVYAAVCKEHCPIGLMEVQTAASTVASARNDEINETGFSASQWNLGKQRKVPGDVLNKSVIESLGEHGALELPRFAARIAMLETAKRALVRLRFSRRLARAEMSRARVVPEGQHFSPGDMVYFYRKSAVLPKHEDPQRRRRRRLVFNRWHGPAIVLGKEGDNSLYIGYRNKTTKCAPEAVRLASSLEQLSAESWAEALADVLEQCQEIPEESNGENQNDGVDAPIDVPEEELRENERRDLLPLLQPSNTGASAEELPAVVAEQQDNLNRPNQDLPIEGSQENEDVASPDVRPPLLSGLTGPDPLGQLRERGRVLKQYLKRNGKLPQDGRPSAANRSSSEPPQPSSSESQPGLFNMHDPISTPVPDDIVRADKRSVSPHTEQEPKRPRSEMDPASPRRDREVFQTFVSQVTEADVLSQEQMTNGRHPLQNLIDDLTHGAPHEFVKDHGSWMGHWSLPTRDEIHRMHDGKPLGTGMSTLRFSKDDNETMLAQRAGRKEISWKQCTPKERETFEDALQEHWKTWLDNLAVEVMTVDESTVVMDRLRKDGELDRVSDMRTVLTDKNDGLRTASNPLPLKASSRIIVPGFKDPAVWDGTLRTDAPTGSRNAQAILCLYAASNRVWHFVSADVRAAFLKGKPYVGREIYARVPDGKSGPTIKGLTRSRLIKVLKGIFGLADAPREWYLRLAECLENEGWSLCLADRAFWYRRDEAGEISGLIVGHVDDLLMTGDDLALASLHRIGDELGFGKIEYNDFVWCGKRMRRAPDGSIRWSMVEYHENMEPVYVSRQRRRDLEQVLTPGELKCFRGAVGSLQWLIAQLRWDLGFRQSTLAGELSKPVVGSLLRANQLIADAKQDSDVELVFSPVDLKTGGVLVVTDAALGNVDVSGFDESPSHKKVFSQSCYLIAFADGELMQGRTGTLVPLDSRSHRIPRVGRSSYAVETMGFEEGVDAAQLIRAMLAELQGHPVDGRNLLKAVDKVPMLGVIDAKDAHDKVASDNNSWGSLKSLAYTIAWLRQQFRRPNVSIRWTATENMFVDAGTKNMPTDHFRRILRGAVWSVIQNFDFVKPKKSKTSKFEPLKSDNVPGTPLSSEKEKAFLSWVAKFRDAQGWFKDGADVVQVARNAKSFRTPEPRYSAQEYPMRSSYGLFCVDGAEVWRLLENRVEFTALRNQHMFLPVAAGVLVSVFSS